MVGYAILVVGAASSRDHSMIAISQLFFAAESRSHEKSSYFGVVSCERFNFRVFSWVWWLINLTPNPD